MRAVSSRHPDEPEPLGRRALVREVVERGQQLAMGEVPRRAEDHQCRWMYRQALETLEPGGFPSMTW